MDIPTLIIGGLGIGVTIVVGAFGFHASSPGEFWLARSLFYVSALLLAGTVFAVQGIANRPIQPSWTVGIGLIGFVIFSGLAASIDWVNRKEAAFTQRAVINAPLDAEREPGLGATANRDAVSISPSTGAATSDPTTGHRDDSTVENRTTLTPPVVTFRDGRARVSFSINYHIEPSDAPLAVLAFGEISRVPDVIGPKVTSVVLAVLEPLSLSEARSHRAELEAEIKATLRGELKKMGITIDSISLAEIEPA